MDDLSRLALAAAGGDAGALEQFVRRSQADVWRLCLALGDRGSADDLTQETFARALTSLHRFRGDGPGARAWLLAIARSTCADDVRRRGRDRRLHQRVAPRDDGHAGGAGVVELQLVLDAIDPGRRDAFVLTQWLGLSYDEAAEVCGCPVGTIRSRVARARHDLRSAVSVDDALGAGGP